MAVVFLALVLFVVLFKEVIAEEELEVGAALLLVPVMIIAVVLSMPKLCVCRLGLVVVVLLLMGRERHGLGSTRMMQIATATIAR